MYLILLLVLIILVRIIVYILGRKKPKVVKFVGPRGTGKTATVNALIGLKNKTVPTLESYKVTHKGMVIHDIIEKSGSFFEKYSIDDPSALYFFFIKSSKDLNQFPETKGFNIRFVYYGALDAKEASERNIIVLNENPVEIEKYLS